jgi:hypothetical protein
MIEFDVQKNSGIPPESTSLNLPKKEDILLFFENHFKKNVDQYMIYKKNQFKSPNKDIIDDFIGKLENFVKGENKDEEKQQTINLIMENFKNSLKLLKECNSLPDNDKFNAFFVSFVLSKVFS